VRRLFFSWLMADSASGGITALGVADEWGFLGPNEVYLSRTIKTGTQQYIEGPVFITRSPTMHPGDIQRARAIGQPPPGLEKVLAGMHDILVFSVEGRRPLCNELGGGDLDGDLYQIFTGPELFPTTDFEPSSYPTVKHRELAHRCTERDLVDFKLEFMREDRLGLVSHRHLLIADQDAKFGSKHGKCLKLAELHSVAVDAPKSGIFVRADELPVPFEKTKPDFMVRSPP
jgi:RNA-dependent RNA polymerase